MAFPVSDEEATPAALSSVDGPSLAITVGEDKPATPSPGRPALKRIK
jgi:hypothetical protein